MSARSVLRVGVIGSGNFAEVCHLPGLRSHPSVDIVALCGRDSARTTALAARFGVERTYRDYRELCASPDIDAVTIVTANAFHAEQALAAFGHGKHVLCEKPLGLTVAEATAMVNAATASGRVHQIAFTYRYSHGVAELRRRIARGDIGAPFYVRMQHDSWEGLVPAAVASWRDNQALAGAGLLFDRGSHLFDVARHVLGPLHLQGGFVHHVARVQPDANGVATPIETDDLATAWFRHESGAHGQWFVSRVSSPFADNGWVQVIGPTGALRAALSRGSVDRLEISRPGRAAWEALPLAAEASDGTPHNLRRMVHAFVDSCLRGRSDPEIDPTFDDGLAVQQALEAVLHFSAQTATDPLTL